MNYGLQKEIYGMTPWLVDVHSHLVLTSMLKNLQNGVAMEVPDVKYNTPYFYNLKNDAKIIYNEYQLDNSDYFEGIAIINLNGVITKSGGMSSVGMEELSISMLEMSKDDRIKGFLILTDSGGGSSCAVEIMNDTILEIKQTKPVYGLISKGGMACSAAYGIISGCTKIYSESEMNVVGSIGTMIEFCGKVANSEDRDGFRYVRLYATKSVKKNKGYEDALNGDYELIINEMLDPINEVFIQMVLTNRPPVSSVSFDDGGTFFSKDCIGSLIDGIASFTEVIEEIQTDKLYSNNSFNNSVDNFNNSNSEKMNKEEYKNAHPVEHAAIVEQGVEQERERVKSWMIYQKADPEAVAAGIEGGGLISLSQREALLVKMSAPGMLENLSKDNVTDLTTAQSGTVEKGAIDEVDAAFAGIDAKLGLTAKVK